MKLLVTLVACIAAQDVAKDSLIEQIVLAAIACSEYS